MVDDMVNSPKHYTQVAGVECIDIIEKLNLPHHVASAFAYIWRFPDKGGLQDIEKAAWYLNRYVKHQRELAARAMGGGK